MIRYLLILWAAMPFVASGQKQGMALADSLVSELRSPRFCDREDTTKAKLYVSLATAYYAIPDSSTRYASLAVQLSEKLGWEPGIATASTALCYDYSAKSEFPKAIEVGRKALAINEKLGNKRDAISSLGNIANCYVALGNYDEAVDLLLRALTLAEQVKSKGLTGLVKQSLAIVYDQLKNYSKSRQYYKEALQLFEQVNDQSNIAVVLTNLGSAYESDKEYAKGLSSVLRAVPIFEKLGNKYSLMVALGIVGGNYRGLGNYPQALAYYRKSRQLSEELGSLEYAASSDKGLGEIFMDMARDTGANTSVKTVQRKYLDSAIIHLEQSVSEGTQVNVSDILAQSHQWLSDAYTLKGNYREALEHQRAATAARDSMYSNDNRLKIAALETKREADLKNKQIEINKLDVAKTRNERALLIGGLVVLFIAVVAVLRAHDKQKKVNGEKETLLKQKDMLMKEIHHRVKNNLQVISTLLDLQLQEVTDEQAKGAMAESTTRVRSISLIHQQLYQHEDIGTIEFSSFAGELVRQVMAVFKKGDVEITFENEIPELHLDIDTAVPLGLILNELITNSFKYAFVGSSNGSIRIAIQHPNGHYKLIYSDSGPGLPDAAQHSSGLGMRMMRSLSKQLGGKFVYDAEAKQVIVTFKDMKGRKMID